MKALLCERYGSPETLVYTDIPMPDPTPTEVRLRIHACGVNFPDILMIRNQYQFRPPLPFSPGGEIAGTVDAVGQEVTAFQPGDRVVALTGWGGFAEYACVPVRRTVSLPADTDFITGAATLYNYGTSFHALKDRAKLQPGETLLVLGAGGGVGLAALELGAQMGVSVTAAASAPATD